MNNHTSEFVSRSSYLVARSENLHLKYELARVRQLSEAAINELEDELVANRDLRRDLVKKLNEANEKCEALERKIAQMSCPKATATITIKIGDEKYPTKLERHSAKVEDALASLRELI